LQRMKIGIDFLGKREGRSISVSKQEAPVCQESFFFWSNCCLCF